MGPIDFRPLLWFGIAIGIIVAVVVGFGAWWLFSHLEFTWTS
jgi:hypothetical protein